MRIVPVIDLQGGQVVHAIAGDRNAYRPLQSRFCRGAQPTSIARAFVEQCRLHEAVVFDLDAIGRAAPAWPAYRALASSGLKLWIDRGIRSLNDAQEVVEFGRETGAVMRIIAGLETIPNRHVLQQVVELVGSDQLVFSVDLFDGRPLADPHGWPTHGWEPIVAQALEIGVQKFMVLDLSQVGGLLGTDTEAICRALRYSAPAAQIIAGGGIRDGHDVRTMASAGCDALLIATALHTGRIKPEQLHNGLLYDLEEPC